MNSSSAERDEQQYQMWLRITGDEAKAERLAREDAETAKLRDIEDESRSV